MFFQNNSRSFSSFAFFHYHFIHKAFHYSKPHTTAFFTKSFAQSFESIPEETIEALEVTGASRLSIFVNAELPAALSQIVAWAGMRLETNFSECAILGMVGAGGVGYVISNSLQGYDYGTAGVAILLVFLVAYGIERVFVRVKKKFY